MPEQPKKPYHDVFKAGIPSGRAVTLEHFFDPERTNILRRFSELDLEHAPALTMLVLGSATPQNVTQINAFLKKAGCKGAMVLIVDSSEESERIHKKRMETLNRKNPTDAEYRFIFEDMRAVNLHDPKTDTGLVNVVISDFTLNFLVRPQDLDVMYAQLRHVLAPGGRAFIHVNACNNDDVKKPYRPLFLMDGMIEDRYVVHPDLNTAYLENQGHDLPMSVFSLEEHIRRAKAAGLKLVGEPRESPKAGFDPASEEVGSFPYMLEFEAT